jgi:predicted nucleotidyltransferase
MARLIETIRQERESILEIAARYQAINVRLFGSVARGEDQSDSDVDFLVDFRPGSTLLDQVGLIEALSKKLGRKVDVVSVRALNRHLSKKILKEALAL